MRDYFGEFLKNPGLGSAPSQRRLGGQRLGRSPNGASRLGQSPNGVPVKYKILWALSLAGTGYGCWKASKVHSVYKTAVKAKPRKARKKKLANPEE